MLTQDMVASAGTMWVCLTSVKSLYLQRYTRFNREERLSARYNIMLTWLIDARPKLPVAAMYLVKIPV